jgi:uncharacterized protein (TIGR02145 family)
LLLEPDKYDLISVMRKNYLITTLTSLVILATLFSCKKDKEDEEDSTNYMTGTLKVDLPDYLIVDKTIQLTASGITEPAEGIEYNWVAPGFSPDSVSGNTITVVTPSETGFYNISITASHDDYASKYNTSGVNIINPYDPDYFTAITEGTDSVTDIRDGKIYPYRKIGDLYWFTANLRWEGAGKPYDTIPALNEVFGSLYTWEEATGGDTGSGLGGGPQGICPEGWTIPTREDWENFATALNSSPLTWDDNWEGVGEKAATDSRLNNTSLWKYSPENKKQNTHGWNGLPGGNTANGFKSFANIHQYGFWWSASEENESDAEYRYIRYNTPDFPYNYANKEQFAASVRCVKLP